MVVFHVSTFILQHHHPDGVFNLEKLPFFIDFFCG